MQDIFLTNTLTGKKEKFVPLEAGKVKMYSCGPTVYDFAHIGNFRSFMMADLLKRVLEYAGYEVTKVSNITDVGHLTNDDLADADGEDKILKKARVENKDPFEIARAFENYYIEDEKKLRIKPPAYRPRATDFIPEQIEIAEKLIEKGFAYEVNGSVYFRVEKFPEYGKLSGNSLKDLMAGARVEQNSEKENPLDFALWKKADESHLMQWDFNTGKVINPGSGNSDSSLKPGFPGWHIECSAMSRKLLGESFDIHTGGEDNIFPHHECEIAQNTCSIDGKVVGAGGVNYWLHGKHLLVDGKKMSKSKGNFYTIRDLLEKGYTGAEIRYLFLSAHYRTALNFTFDSLEMARGSIARIVEAKRLLSEFLEGKDLVNSEQESSVRKEFKKELFDDLNVSGALAVVFEGINVLMKWREDGTLKAEIAQDFLDFLENDFNQVFNIFPEEQSLANEDVAEIEAKIEERKVARENKDWAKSDEIRDYLLEKFGIELIDEAGGTSFRVK